MNKIKIKICGLQREADILCAANLGVDYVGFIFYKKSPRYIATDCVKIPILSEKVKKVGVFVNEDINTIKHIYAKLKLDIVQIHGDEPPQFCNNLNIPYWKAFRVGEDEKFDIDSINNYACDTIVIDSYSKNSYGGTGKRVSTSTIKQIIEKCSDKKVIVAGGVSVANVDEIIGLNPHGVDINSSVETFFGIKDCAKIEEIVKKIQEREK